MVAPLADAPVVLFGAEQTMQDDYRSMLRFGFGRLMQVVRQAKGAFNKQTSLDSRFPGSGTGEHWPYVPPFSSSFTSVEALILTRR